MKKDQATIFVCPMHPEVTSEKQGVCPKCGMNLIESKVKEVKEKEIIG